jgi:Protein of unknown function (DUF664)
MTSAALLTDAFGRVQETVREATEGMTEEQLAFRLDDDANPIGWLIWHLTRVQDDHIAAAFGTRQVWVSGEWAPRFGLPPGSMATGYAHRSREVAALRVPSVALLLDYYDAVHEQTIKHVSRITDADLERVVDEAWDPPVTLSVRLVSVISDCLQHAGQAAFIRGILLRQPT